MKKLKKISIFMDNTLYDNNNFEFENIINIL